MLPETTGTKEPRPPRVRLRCEECGTPVHLPVAGPASARRVGARSCESCGERISLERVHSLVSPTELDELLTRSPIPLLVDFHAEWCGPCRWLEPVLDDLARECAGRVLVVKVDTDRIAEVAREHRVASLPTVILFRNGRERDRSLGIEPERLKAMVADSGCLEAIDPDPSSSSASAD